MRGYRWFWCALICTGLAVMGLQVALAQPVSGGPVSPGAGPSGDPPVSPPDADIPEGATPEEIAEHCIAKATEMADRCVGHNEQTASWSVAIIEDLLAAGEVEKARHVALWSIHFVNTHTDRCVHGIRHLCGRCIRAIIRAGGNRELVERVRAACEEQIHRVLESRRAAVEQIKGALGEDVELPGEPLPEE